MPIPPTDRIRIVLAGMLCAGLSFNAALAQSADRKVQPKIIAWNSQSEVHAESLIGIVGQIQRPGTYRCPGSITLQQLITGAGGLTPTASPTLRIIRNHRELEHVVFQPSGADPLRSGDLVVIDQLPIHHGSSSVSEAAGVQLAFLGVMDYPVVVKVSSNRAHLAALIELLGQSPEIMSRLKVIPPQGRQFMTPAEAQYSPALTLADGSVLVFDQHAIQRDSLAESLPEILTCNFYPESPPQPDIVGYSQGKGLPPQIRPSAVEPPLATRTDSTIAASEPPINESLRSVPPPPDSEWESFTETLPPAPISREKSPSFKTTGQSGNSKMPVSRVPFSARGEERTPPRNPAPAFRAKLPGDAREPAWNAIKASQKTAGLSAASSKTAELSPAEPAPSTGPLTGLQMSAIIASVGVLIGLALIVRRWQNAAETAGSSASPQTPRPHSSKVAQHLLRYERGSKAISAPHFLESASSRPEHLSLRQLRFTELVRNELAIHQEPLALRPGLQFHSLPELDIVRRTDAAQQPIAPHLAPAPARQPISASVEPAPRIQQLDSPHPAAVPEPHFPLDISAPLERALRQLEGGRA